MPNAVYTDPNRQRYELYTGKFFTVIQKSSDELLHGYAGCVSTHNNRFCTVLVRNTPLYVYNSFIYKIRLQRVTGYTIGELGIHSYRQISNISRTKSQNLNVFRIILDLSGKSIEAWR